MAKELQTAWVDGDGCIVVPTENGWGPQVHRQSDELTPEIRKHMNLGDGNFGGPEFAARFMSGACRVAEEYSQLAFVPVHPRLHAKNCRVRKEMNEAVPDGSVIAPTMAILDRMLPDFFQWLYEEL